VHTSRVRLWHSSFDVESGGHTHTTAEGFGHALLVPSIANVFRVLGISASIWDGEHWWPIYSHPSVVRFELEHSAETERAAHNSRSSTRALETRQLVVGQHRGYSDFFTPILKNGEVVAMLVCGTVSTAHATSASIEAEWKHLTGRKGHMDDPEFQNYLENALGSLVLTGEDLAKFCRLLELSAQLFAGEENAGELANQIERIYLELRELRFTERTWEAVTAMLDDRFPRTWSGVARAADLQFLGLDRVPDQVLVALFSPRATEEALDEAIRREAFQREAVALARRIGNVVAGKVGDRGVVFLSAAEGSSARKRQKLSDITARAGALAQRKFGLRLYAGASVAGENEPVQSSYQAALGAAESAVEVGSPLVIASPETASRANSIKRRWRELASVFDEAPEHAIVRFERYLEAVEAEYSRRRELARVHLEFGLERLVEPLLRSGGVEAKGLELLRQSLERWAERSTSVAELVAAYREAAKGLFAASQKPTPARHDRNLKRALSFIHRHYTEQIRALQVAKVAGFAPNYFSRLFKQREKVTFEQYVARLRIERAKQLLSTTRLDVKTVAARSGFTSPQYLSRVLQRAAKVTPLEYRKLAPYTHVNEPTARARSVRNGGKRKSPRRPLRELRGRR
jgi:AraC-like DNA-binding protein